MSGTKIKTRLKAETSLINPMKSDITFSIIVENEFTSIDLKKWFKKAFEKEPDFTALSGYCLDKILNDQFKDDDAKGAWSKRNSDYVKYLCEQDGTDFNESTKESITMSSMIVSGLVACKKYVPKDRSKVSQCLMGFKEYLGRNYNVGFGVKKLSGSGSSDIPVTPHHNTRAIIALNELNDLDHDLRYKLRKASDRLVNDIDFGTIKLEHLAKFGKYESISALHKLLSSSYAENLNFRYKSIPQLKKEIEHYLYESYDRDYKTWGVKVKTIRSESIDKALFILSDLSLSSIHDNHLREIYIDAIDNILTNHLINVGDDELAIPFVIGGKPDLAATIQFYWILLKNINYSKNFNRDLNKLTNFILSFDLYGSIKSEFNYPWYLSSIFLINQHYKEN